MAARKITGLIAQKRNPQRVNVYLDGEFAFGVARIVAAWLSVGQELSDEKIAQLQADDEREVAYLRAIKYLNYRPRSRSELKTNLTRHNVSEEVVEEILGRLEEIGLVDDDRFANNWVENRSEFRPRSRRALRLELRQRGLEPETIEKSLAEVDEEGLAYQAAAKYARRLSGLDRTTFRQKMIAYLSRRGFSYETSAGASARVWAEQQEVENESDNGKVESR
jgi:regulatory protein